MQIRNLTKNTCIAVNYAVADNFASRFMGLMGRSSLAKGSGLIITPCNSIHMLFMRFPLDVLFINKDNIVVHRVENIAPWRLSKVVWEARSVIELPVGTIKSSKTEVGDKLSLN